MSAPSATSAYFDRQAGFWRDLYDDHRDVYALIHGRRREWALHVVDGLGLAAGTPVLDVGAGAGGAATALAQRGLEVTVVDASSEMLALTGQTADRCGVGDQVTRVHADAADLPFPAVGFPLVLALGLVPWVDDAGAVVRELARVTAPGGRVVLSGDNGDRLTHALDPLRNRRLARLRRAVASAVGRAPWAGVRSTTHSAAEMRGLLADAGLVVDEASTLGFGPFTFLGHAVLPHRLGLRVNAFLQRLADRGLPRLRSAGCQHLVVARRPAARPHGQI
ncbi:MAG: class I SAM-dependent methyltransferase [Marmoricola sp.]